MKLPLPPKARSALLIIDMQEYFFREPGRRQNLEQVVKNINTLVGCFDQCAFPVFHVVSRFKADGSNWDLKMKAAGKPELIEGTWEAAILPEVTVLKSHTQVTKPVTVHFSILILLRD